MSKELDKIFGEISRWSVEEIESIMHHEKWTRDGKNPFKDQGINKPKKPRSPINNNRNELVALLDQDFEDFIPEQIAKTIIISTFLLMNDEAKLRHGNINKLINQSEIKTNLLQLLGAMDKDWLASGQKITKLQLFYALYKQRENSEFEIKKVTWANVTSEWGPKIVMTDGESYYYVFKQIDDFEMLHKRYNIAAMLGRNEQYKSEYLTQANDFNLNILKVNATSKCTTLAEYFTNNNMGLEMNKSNTKLFERLSEEFFRNKLEAGLYADTDELMKILPRLAQEEKGNPCLSSILNTDKEWIIPRTQVEADEQEYYVVHGDEWGGNFLVTESARQVFMIDFEDAIFANANNRETVIRVGGDLSSRIYSLRKKEPQDFLPIGLSIFASIGRLLAAIVQFHARNQNLGAKNIEAIISNYVTSFEKSFKEKNETLYDDYWIDFRQLILLHAWDWALYWREKGNPFFPKMHYDKFIEEIKKLLGCHEEKDNWKTVINNMVSDLPKADIPKLSESQYNIFSRNIFNFMTSYKGEITDKVFEVQLKKLTRIEDTLLKIEYIKQNILPNCQDNSELEYFSLLYIILNSDYYEAKNHYDRIGILAHNLSVESGDDEYRYTSQLLLFYSSSLEQDPGKFYDGVINIPHGPLISSGFFIFSRFLLSNYHMSMGEYPIALEFNIEAGEFLPKESEFLSAEEVSLWWSLYNTRCILYVQTDNTEELNSIMPNLVMIFEEVVLKLDENTIFCNSNQFYTLLGESDDYDNQERILEYFNKPEFKDELEDENLAQLHLWNGQKFQIEKEFGKSIQYFELAASYATNQKMKSNALCFLGSSHYHLGQFKEAIYFIEQGMKLDESELEYWRIYDMFASCCVKTEDYLKAIQYLEKCAKVNHKLYLNNSKPEHFHYFLRCSKEALMLGFNVFRGKNPPFTVHSELVLILRKGIREFKKTSYKDDFCESILIQLREICKICSSIDPLLSSNQLDRIEREWKKKQKSNRED